MFNFLGNMYGGVATPLALLHQPEGNGRQKHYGQISARATSSREIESTNGSYSVANAMMPRVMPLSAPRLPPLRETAGRELSQNGENEPLLPSHATPKVHSIQRSLHNGKKVIVEPDLPPPPLPPHKNNISVQKLNPDMKYTPPWPRGPCPSIQNHVDNIKPYLKPLPKPPGKESPNHHKYHRQVSVPITRQAIQPLRLENLTPERTHDLKHKLKSNIHNPLYHLQRHYSDESLQGSTHYGCSIPQRIHSSADEISSLNHSPSISSSDESYSRTTDADLSPSPSPPPHGETNEKNTKQWLFPSDIQVNPCSSPETSPKASVDYIPPQCFISSNGNTNQETQKPATSRSFSPNSKGKGAPRKEWAPSKGNSSDRSKHKEEKVENMPPQTLLALAAETNTIDSSLMSSPPLQDCDESYKGDSCTSFEFIGRQRIQKPPSLLRTSSNEKPASKIPIKQRSLDKNMFKIGENVIEANKMSVNNKRSPHRKELDEIGLVETPKGSLNSEKSLKKDGSSQTDKKDMSDAHLKTIYNGNEKTIPSLVTTKLLNDISANAEAKVETVLLSKMSGPFEREIQKFLDEQNLLKNNPPKNEISHQTKEILSLDELHNISDNKEEKSVLARYARSPLNCNNNPITHQVGLAAIQALARKQQDELNNLVENENQFFKFNTNKSQDNQENQDNQRESSKESSLKRSRVNSNEDVESSKVPRISSLPKDFPASLNSLHLSFR